MGARGIALECVDHVDLLALAVLIADARLRVVHCHGTSPPYSQCVVHPDSTPAVTAARIDAVSSGSRTQTRSAMVWPGSTAVARPPPTLRAYARAVRTTCCGSCDRYSCMAASRSSQYRSTPIVKGSQPAPGGAAGTWAA